MVTAVKAGAIVPPADIRFLRLGANPQHGETPASRIISFLQNVYESVAETLPDARKEEHDCKTTLTECGSEQDQDPYATAFMDGVAVPIKPRHKPRAFKSLKLDPALVVEQEDRWLPPGGHMKDYWEQMCLHEPAVSFCQFWRVTRKHFEIFFFKDD